MGDFEKERTEGALPKAMSHGSDGDSLHVGHSDGEEIGYIDIECYAGASGSALGVARVDPDATVGQLKARLREKRWLPPRPYALLIGDHAINPDDDYFRFTNTAEFRGQRFLVLNIVVVNLA